MGSTTYAPPRVRRGSSQCGSSHIRMYVRCTEAAFNLLQRTSVILLTGIPFRAQASLTAVPRATHRSFNNTRSVHNQVLTTSVKRYGVHCTPLGCPNRVMERYGTVGYGAVAGTGP
eukprot:178030-Chlamydomonas_euryale.AAC.17